MKYKMVIFDLDGTILNTIKDLCVASNEALKKFKLNPITIEDTQKYLGHGIRHLIDMASCHSSEVDLILKHFKEYYVSHYNIYTRPYEGIREVLNWCHQKGIILGVFSNKVEMIARALCDEHFPNDFDFVYGEVEGRKRKPDVSFLISLINSYSLSLDEVLYIGDSDVDIKTCENAKIDGLFVSYGFRDKEFLKSISTQVVDSPEEILEFLKR